MFVVVVKVRVRWTVPVTLRRPTAALRLLPSKFYPAHEGPEDLHFAGVAFRLLRP